MSELGVVAAIHRDTNSLTAVIPAWGLRPIEGISYGGEPPPLSFGWFDDEGAGGSWVYNRPRGPAVELLRDHFLHGGGRRGVRLRRSTAQTVTSNSHDTITWNAEDFDSDGYIAVSSTTVTIPPRMGGIYHVMLRVAWSADPTSTYIGFTAAGSRYNANPSFFAGVFGGVCEATIPLRAGDTIECQIYQNSGSNKTITAHLSALRTDDTDYGDTGWDLVASPFFNTVVGTGLPVASAGHGVLRLRNSGGSGLFADDVILRKATQCLLTSSDEALWLSARVRVSAVPGEEDVSPAYLVGFADDDLDGNAANAALELSPLGTGDPNHWRVSGLGALGGAVEFATGVDPIADEWVDLDLVTVGDSFAAGWVNGDGPYTIASVPDAGIGVHPFVAVNRYPADPAAHIDLDYVRVVAFSDYAGPDQLQPSIEGIVEDPIAQA